MAQFSIPNATSFANTSTLLASPPMPQMDNNLMHKIEPGTMYTTAAVATTQPQTSHHQMMQQPMHHQWSSTHPMQQMAQHQQLPMQHHHTISQQQLQRMPMQQQQQQPQQQHVDGGGEKSLEKTVHASNKLLDDLTSSALVQSYEEINAEEAMANPYTFSVKLGAMKDANSGGGATDSQGNAIVELRNVRLDWDEINYFEDEIDWAEMWKLMQKSSNLNELYEFLYDILFVNYVQKYPTLSKSAFSVIECVLAMLLVYKEMAVFNYRALQDKLNVDSYSNFNSASMHSVTRNDKSMFMSCVKKRKIINAAMAQQSQTKSAISDDDNNDDNTNTDDDKGAKKPKISDNEADESDANDNARQLEQRNLMLNYLKKYIQPFLEIGQLFERVTIDNVQISEAYARKDKNSMESVKYVVNFRKPLLAPIYRTKANYMFCKIMPDVSTFIRNFLTENIECSVSPLERVPIKICRTDITLGTFKNTRQEMAMLSTSANRTIVIHEETPPEWQSYFHTFILLDNITLSPIKEASSLYTMRSWPRSFANNSTVSFLNFITTPEETKLRKHRIEMQPFVTQLKK